MHAHILAGHAGRALDVGVVTHDVDRMVQIVERLVDVVVARDHERIPDLRLKRDAGGDRVEVLQAEPQAAQAPIDTPPTNVSLRS